MDSAHPAGMGTSAVLGDAGNAAKLGVPQPPTLAEIGERILALAAALHVPRIAVADREYRNAVVELAKLNGLARVRVGRNLGQDGFRNLVERVGPVLGREAMTFAGDGSRSGEQGGPGAKACLGNLRACRQDEPSQDVAEVLRRAGRNGYRLEGRHLLVVRQLRRREIGADDLE